ncbi:MAG TPA: hypothetical protein VHZ26_17020 [Caulobacteraceae bacterium]|jgi:hypothetical protein|nr:hypothetical protein [Caulobacteraceae bacterium]
MGWIAAIAREIWGLFVDDIGLAVASLVWIGLIWLGAGWLGPAAGPSLFAGLVVILLSSAFRRAGQ